MIYKTINYYTYDDRHGNTPLNETFTREKRYIQNYILISLYYVKKNK